MFFNFLTTIAKQLFWRTHLGGCFCDKFATNTVANTGKYQVLFCSKFFSWWTIISHYNLYIWKVCYTIKIHYFSEFETILFGQN